MFFRLLSIIILILFLQIPSLSQEIPIPFHPAQDLPYFESPQVTIDSAEYNTLFLRIESKQNGTARLFWATHYDMQFNHSKNVWFSVKAGRHGYYFNMPSQNPNWIGWVKGFIIYPEIDPKLVEIEEAKVIRGNIFTNIKSGWQEFWGPNGRVVIGSTINLIPSSSVFGRSVNIYIYWMIGIFFIIVLATKLFQSSWDLNSSLSQTLQKSFILIITCWVLLALNSDYNFLKIFKDNHSKYFGKTIEQKRAVAYGKDYYDFLAFSKENLPKEPVKFGLLSLQYAASLQARIYLVPHVYAEKDFPYLLVFNPGAEQKVDAAKYKSFAKLNNNAYILKRIEK